MSTNSWSDAEEDRLIQIVSQNPVVFDVNNEGYRNIMYKEKVWQQIATQLGRTSEDVRKKWKFIRDGYKRFLRRHPSGTHIPKSSKNKRHRLLSFIDNYNFGEVTTFMTTSPDVDLKADGEASTYMMTSPDLDLKPDVDEIDPIAFNTTECNNEENSTDNDGSSEEYKPSRKPAAKRRKKINSNKEDVLDLLEQLKDSGEKTKVLLKTIIKRKDDDVEHYCRHIAEVLRKLPPVEKAHAKKHLSAVLSEYEITAAKNSSSNNGE